MKISHFGENLTFGKTHNLVKYQFFVGFSPNARFLQELSNDCQVYTLLIRLGHGKYGVYLLTQKTISTWRFLIRQLVLEQPTQVRVLDALPLL